MQKTPALFLTDVLNDPLFFDELPFADFRPRLHPARRRETDRDPEISLAMGLWHETVSAFLSMLGAR